jgi:hypothetical protein
MSPDPVFGRPAAPKTARHAPAGPMRDIKADWKRWSRAERIGAVGIFATLAILYGATLVEAVAG